MTKKATVELNMQRDKISSTFYVSNCGDWDAILGQPFQATLHVIMNVKNNKVSIQPTEKLRQQLHMLQKQAHAVSTAACSIYDDDDFSNNSSSDAPETYTEDAEAAFARCYEGLAAHIQSCIYCLHESQSVSTNTAQITSVEEKIFRVSPDDSDSNSSTPEESAYERIFTESDIHSWLTCESAEQIIAQAQPQYVTLQGITNWEMEFTDYDNMESTEEVGPDPVTCNALTTLPMCDLTTEFPELFPEEKSTELPAL